MPEDITTVYSSATLFCDPGSKLKHSDTTHYNNMHIFIPLLGHSFIGGNGHKL